MWYIRKGVPLDYRHFLSRVAQLEGKACTPANHSDFLGTLRARVAEINWENAKEDVLPFVKDASELDIWSTDFFLKLTDMLTVTP